MMNLKQRVGEHIKSENFFPYRLKASYTVEAAAVMGTCMIFMGLIFMRGIDLYGAAMTRVAACESYETRPQDTFRFTRAIERIGNIYMDSDKEGEGS